MYSLLSDTKREQFNEDRIGQIYLS